MGELDRRQFAGTALVAAACMASSPLRGASNPPAPAFGLDALLTSVSEALLVEYPDDATFLGLDEGPHVALHAKLTDRSITADADRAASCARRLTELRQARAAISGIGTINLDATTTAHELADEGYRSFQFGDIAVLNVWQAEASSPYVVSQATGFFATIPDFLDSQHKVETAADAEAYLNRLIAFGQGLEAENERMKRDAAAGSIAPGFLLDTTLKQQTAYQVSSVEDWGLITSLTGRAAAKGIKGDWQRRASAICRQVVAPALGRQVTVLKELRAKSSQDAGCWKIPNGDAYYGWLLRVGTTTALGADEIHQLGLDQTREIDAEMDTLLKRQGLSKGTVGQRMSALGRDPRFLFTKDDAGRAKLLTYLNGVITDMRARLPQAFATSHKADLVIKRVPPSIEAGAPGGYEQDGPIDGSRPASYYINLRDTANFPRFSLPTLCFHEGLPGHVWQGTFAHDLPTIRSQLAFNAYIEGWALYAEQLGDELGVYADDPFGRLGYLQSMQFRACRLVVDTGLHAKRWTREKAVAWMVEHNGNATDAARSEIDRYCAWPGQACGYQIGHLHINDLRKKATLALGSRFDIRLFNDALLTSGSVPLTLLDRIVDRHIAARRA